MDPRHPAHTRLVRAGIRGTGAVLAALSAVLHVSSPTVLTAVMAVGCLYCAYHLWRFDSVRSWLFVAVMNIAMIAAHLPWAGHRHGAALSAEAAGAADMAVAMQLATAIAGAEILFAATVLYVRTRAPR
jgi:hypothetical protein